MSTEHTAKRRRLSPRPEQDEIEVDGVPDTTGEQSAAESDQLRARRKIGVSQDEKEDEEEDGEEEDDDEVDSDDDQASVGSAMDLKPSQHDKNPQPMPNIIQLSDSTPADMVIEIEEAANSMARKAPASASTTPAPVADPGSTQSRPPGSEADGDGEPDEEMDAEGEREGSSARASVSAAVAPSTDSVTAAGEIKPKIEPKTEKEDEEILIMPIPDAEPTSTKANLTTATSPTTTTMTSAAPATTSNPKKGMKTNGEDVAITSVAGNIDPKLLRGPLLDISLEDTFVDLSDLFNRGLSFAERIPEPDKDDISLARLFPELSVYDMPEAPSPVSTEATSGGDGSATKKMHKRVDESGMSTGRLTYASRLMDANNVLLSALQPGLKYKNGVWEDPNDSPIPEEVRDYSKAPVEFTPPSAGELTTICLYLLVLNQKTDQI